MSTSDQQDTPQLTRRQLRELRETGVTPVVPPAPSDADTAPDAPAAEPSSGESPSGGASAEAPLLTRRELREIGRTAEVATVSGAHDATEEAAEPAPVKSRFSFLKRRREEEVPEDEAGTPSYAAPAEAEPTDEGGESTDDPAAAEDTPEGDVAASDEDVSEEPQDEGATADAEDSDAGLDPDFGAGVGTEDKPSGAFTPSFDELVMPADTTGSQHIAPASLIFNQPGGQPSLSGPITGTGDIIVTGSYDLPSSLASHGQLPGTADGKDIDAALVDGELSDMSSPMPVAASSAISTLKPAGEVIRQPTPEKGSKLLMGLALTAGGLMIALSVALILAFTNGVF